MEMSLRRTRKIVVKRTLILSKSTTIAMENGKALCSAPSVNTAIPHYNQFEIKSSNFNFSSEKKVLSIRILHFCWICCHLAFPKIS
jgi:hypothetical protein